MKVLIISSRVPFPLRDGGAIATFNLVKGLTDIGVEVDFATLNTNKHHVDEQTLKSEFGFIHQLLAFDVVTDVRPLDAFLNLFSNQSYNIERFTNIEFASKIQELLDRNQYDLIQFEGLFVAQYLQLIKTNVPCILRQHNIEYMIWERLQQHESNPLKKWYLKLLANRLKKFEKTITPLFDAVVSITKDDEMHSRAELNAKLTNTIPAGLMTADFPLNSIDLNSIYHVGSMEWMPNQDAMNWFHESIWPIIAKQSPEAVFYMGGKNMPDAFLSFNDRQFNVVGEIQDLKSFTKDKSILAVPLRSGSGIRIKTIEAMISGKAVVTTKIGAQGLPLIHEVNCLIADDEQSFAAAILRLMNDESLRNRLAKNGYEMAVSEYGNDSISKKWLNLYQQLKR
ncbi:MAG TPA: glycosyltransferase family 4 protein [Bacteroidia bacterium]